MCVCFFAQFCSHFVFRYAQKDQFQWFTTSKTSAITRCSVSHESAMNRTPCAIYFCTKPVTVYMKLVFIKTMISNSPMSIRKHEMAEQQPFKSISIHTFYKNTFIYTPKPKHRINSLWNLSTLPIRSTWMLYVSFCLCNNYLSVLLNERATNLAIGPMLGHLNVCPILACAQDQHV